MTRKIGMALLVMLLVFSFCSKKKGEAPVSAAGQNEQPRARQAEAANQPLDIKAATLSPESPTVLDDVTAVPLLADPGREDVDFQYQWFINGAEMPGVSGDKLEKANFKKGSWLYYRVKAVSRDGESPWFKSDAIRVQNSLPALRLPPVGNFAVPGEFKYQVGASDPDGDALTYELLSPLDQGIVLDPRTGVLTWKIDAETVDRLGKKIEIKFAVSDNNDGKTSGTITLDLTEPK